MLLFVLILVVGLLAGPLTYGYLNSSEAQHWSQRRWDSSGQAPDPATYQDAVVQVYAARTYGWKGAFAVHSWIILKEKNAKAYERYDVAGWGIGQDRPAIRRDMRVPDGYWAGNKPMIVSHTTGPAAELAIPKIRAAIAAYPYRYSYVTWPGPNSNTFIASILRQVPELRTAMPPNAVGKDFLPYFMPFAMAPSGTGVQFSLAGLLGMTLAKEEGLEINILGMVFGINPLGPAVKVPGFGTISFNR
ncbi:Protein of unknown function [Arboricoccus pini]|uniref:DUF3750 domain-containing protein n=1 Tax=Arboricoccus pini TaxID=1963835 RepID=A0A212QRR4_9PROT|nr:DUF3750 domain-containing protein [Arboricoccus pini]SNB62297.1 Protein of unknown function [Arboricoccus pini]